MDEGATEKGSIIKRFFKKPELEKPVVTSSNFERDIFKNGVYEFDFDEEISDAERSVLQHKAWLERSWEKHRHKESMDYTVSHERHDVMWKQAFSGLIPKHWNHWVGIKDDFENAGKQHIQLSSTLVDAGVSHSHHLVLNEVGKSQKLSVEQLAVVMARREIDNIPPWNYDEVVTAQRKKGLTESDYSDARKLSREYVRNMRNRPKEEAGTFIAPPRTQTKPLLNSPKPRLGGGD